MHGDCVELYGICAYATGPAVVCNAASSWVMDVFTLTLEWFVAVAWVLHRSGHSLAACHRWLRVCGRCAYYYCRSSMPGLTGDQC